MKEVTKAQCSSCLVFDEHKNKGYAGRIGIMVDKLLIAEDIHDPSQRALLKRVIATALYLEAEDEVTALLSPSEISILAN